ncbi:MAG: class I SAM-dependent methyltransferase, partial [Armatimonadetes bacterium]|nr:class I SAM-dependent methyltransferase [Armatimonadota bacterium]
MFNYCPACLSKNLIKKKSYKKFWNCKNCGSLFQPEGVSFKSYNLTYFQERGHDKSNFIINQAKLKTFKNFWEILGNNINQPILEVGSASGLSLKAALEMGLNIYGYDLDPCVIELCKENNINQERLIIQDFKKIKNLTFGTVAFFDSFEHIPDVQKFLTNLNTYLKEICTVIIVIPNAESLSRIILGNFWPHFTEDHWIHYTEKALKIIFNEFNFKL